MRQGWKVVTHSAPSQALHLCSVDALNSFSNNSLSTLCLVTTLLFFFFSYLPNINIYTHRQA
ncbi:hypothetical protein BJX62DRAFT_193426 [Aspergillus germanicus]